MNTSCRWCLALLLVTTASLYAQKPAVSLSDPADLETFLEGVMASQLAAHKIPGATLSIVKDGKLFFAKGYGYSDVDQRKPVLADRSLFRIGSVSKLFVWTAVMQLYEQGKLDLDKDLNEYLKEFKIPASYSEPVTMKHLMSHSPGFEDRYPIFAHRAEDLEPSGEFLARTFPARIRPPSQYSAYTNHGTALAAYIVEQISGKPFEEYVEENIFKPLQMGRSSFRQPLPSSLEHDLSGGYAYSAGAFEAKPFEFVRVAAAGSMSATATDMANFMIAHLQSGRFGSERILGDAAARTMHSYLFTHDARANGWAYGFMEISLNNVRMIGHGGDTRFFHTLLALLPEQNMGLFVSYNSMGEGEGAAAARVELLRALLDRYYPAPPDALPEPPADFLERAGHFEASYWPTRLPSTTAHKIMGLFQQVTVTVRQDSTLFTEGPFVRSRKWVEIEPMRFRPVGGPSSSGDLLFWENADQRIIGYCTTNNPTTAFLRVPWHASLGFNIILLAASLTLLLTVIIAWPIRFFLRRRHSTTGIDSRGAKTAQWFALIVSALFLLFTLAFIVSLGDPYEFAFEVPQAFVVALWLGLAGSIMTIGLLVCSVLAWKYRYWGTIRRVHYTLVTLAAIGFVWWLNFWNLLGFKL
jgi:CubicO group peptidase (beta-lactamase class C family)/uncharacterized integral membrane protein